MVSLDIHIVTPPVMEVTWQFIVIAVKMESFFDAPTETCAKMETRILVFYLDVPLLYDICT